MTRSGVSAEALFGYQRHQGQKRTDITHAKALTLDALIEADGPLPSPFGDSFCERDQ